MDESEFRAILSRSVRGEDLNLVEDFIKKHGFHLNNKVDLNVQDDFGRTPIFYAVQSGNIEIVEFLIEIKVDLNIRDIDGMTPIFFVIRQPNNINDPEIGGISSTADSDCKHKMSLKKESESIKVAMLKLLLSKGATTGFIDFKKHKTVLHYAAEEGYTEVIKILIEFKANVNREAKDGSTPISLSVANGHLETCRVLLEHGALVNETLLNGFTPLLLASKSNHLSIVKCLLEANADVNDQVPWNEYTALHYAAMAGSRDMAKLLLEHGALVNATANGNNGFTFSPYKDTPLLLASKNNHLTVVKCLLEAKADVNAQNWPKSYTALHYAAKAGSKDMVELLLEHGASVNSISRFKDTPLIHDDKETPLHLASKNNHLSVVKYLLDAKADANAQVPCSRYTPLHYAAEAGSKYIVELLLKHGALVNSIAKDKQTPLLLASKNNQLSIVKCLLEAKADINAQSSGREYTALHYAAMAGSRDMTELLLEHGALVNSISRFKETPLLLASKNKYLPVVQCLLEAEANVNVQKSCCVTTPLLGALVNIIDVSTLHPFQLAELNYRLGAVKKYLLKAEADVNVQKSSNRCTPLHYEAKAEAAEANSKDIIQLLFQSGALVNSIALEKQFPLLLAIKKNHLGVVKCLLEAKADVNAPDSCSGYTPLHYAAEAGSKDMAELLLEHGALVNSISRFKETPLLLASKNNHLSVAKCLLEVKADFNAQVSRSDCRGYTPLHYAAKAGSKSIAELLLENGALVNSISSNQVTPLLLASQNNHLSVVKYLLDAKADVNAHDDYTPLHYAAEAGSKDMAELLLEHGALVNSINEVKETPLHLASQNNHLSVVKYLMQAKADVNAQVSFSDFSGYTPLHYAAKAGSKDIAELLLDHGALVNTKCNNGCTPLHIACEFVYDMGQLLVNPFNVTNLLLERGAQVDLQNKWGKTALDLACSSKLTNIAELLLKFDANPNARNRKIGSPDQLDDELLDILLSSGAVFTDAPLSSKPLTRHIVKLNMSIRAGFNSPFRLHYDEKNEYALNCEEEISRMMSEKIGEANLTFFNILASDVGEVAVLTRNREVCRAFEEGNLDDIYPIYGKELRRRFRNGLERSELLKKAVDSFHSLCLELPQEICEKILSYLSHKDLVSVKRIAA